MNHIFQIVVLLIRVVECIENLIDCVNIWKRSETAIPCTELSGTQLFSVSTVKLSGSSKIESTFFVGKGISKFQKYICFKIKASYHNLKQMGFVIG